MNKLLPLVLIASCAFVFAGNAGAQTRTTVSPRRTEVREEVAPTRYAAAAAPAEAVQRAREIILYLFHEKPDIASDTSAQTRWLSEPMRKALANRQKVYANYAKENPDSPEGPPSNSDFIGSWNYPTSFRFVGSRLSGQRAVVDVLFRWGKNTEYPGDTRLTYYVMVRENGSWKLEDIYTFEGKFVAAESLLETFRQSSYP
jgi:hypothetical protein